MEPQDLQPSASLNRLRLFSWLIAALTAISAAIELFEDPIPWLSVAGQVSLILAAVLLATARPAEMKTKLKIVYVLVGIYGAVVIAKLVNRWF